MFKFLVTLAVLAVAAGKNLKDRSYYEEKFFEWMKTHSVAAKSGSHFVQMLQNFANNDDLIETHNAGNHSYELGHNQFSHMSVEEWREYVKLGLNRPTQTPSLRVHEEPVDVSSLATSIDWTTLGAVTPVKDQGQCGSCWSFSATGALEGAYYNKHKTLKSFSEQHFVDCDNRSNSNNKGTDMGCNGGLMDSAFEWASKNTHICMESEYKYVSGTTKKSGTCNESQCVKDSTTVPKGYVDVTKNSDSALMSALNLGPVSVAIEADQASFQLYKSGVFDGSCGTNLDHGVLAVGYGTDNGKDFYKVKNSWGTSWGEQGYIRFARGASLSSGQKQGQCGILSGPPSYPTF